MLIVEEQSRSKNYGVRERLYVVVHTILFLSSILGVEKFKFIQFLGLIVSFTGVLIIFSHADLSKIINSSSLF